MFRFFLLFFFLGTLLVAQTNQEILDRADRLARTGKTNDIFRAYNDYKNLYLQSILKNDDKLKVKALNGIVVTGKELHIDISEYSEELRGMNGHITYKQPVKEQQRKIEKEDKSISLSSMTKLESVKWDNDDLVMSFDEELKPDQVRYFVLHDIKHRKYRYVFDISSAFLFKSEVLFKKGISRIKLNQFNPKTVRLVFEDEQKLNLHFELDKSDLVISLYTKERARKTETITKQTPRVSKKEKTHLLDRNKVIVIDPGHGGKDSGAIGYRHYYEKNVVLDIAKKAADILKKRGYKVYMTRDRDIFIKLKARTAFANDKDADLFISVHANAVRSSQARKAYGIETYFLSPSRSTRATHVAELENSADLSDMNSYGKSTFLKFMTNTNRIASNKLAIDLQKGILSNLRNKYKGVSDAGVREGPFWVLVGAQMPAVLIEVGFITNPTEANRLMNEKYKEHMAYGIADGVDRYFVYNN